MTAARAAGTLLVAVPLIFTAGFTGLQMSSNTLTFCAVPQARC
jgi:hypothetical protein